MRKMMGVVTVIALLGAASTAQAQIGFGAQGGVAFPIGDNMEGLGTGWHIDGTLSFDPALLPVGVRLEGGYVSMGAEEDLPLEYQQLHLIANGIVGMGLPAVSPYLIGGLGYYRDRVDVEDSDVDVDWSDNVGANIGVGLDLPLGMLDAYVETRFHHVFADESRQMIPVTFGLRF